MWRIIEEYKEKWRKTKDKWRKCMNSNPIRLYRQERRIPYFARVSMKSKSKKSKTRKECLLFFETDRKKGNETGSNQNESF